ncbi:MAG: hypothetical protein AB1697_04910 [Pseudomonadota bacterium]
MTADQLVSVSTLLDVLLAIVQPDEAGVVAAVLEDYTRAFLTVQACQRRPVLEA